MTLFANAPGYQTNITNMPESGLIVLAVGSIILGCALLIPVMLAGAPRRTEPSLHAAVDRRGAGRRSPR